MGEKHLIAVECKWRKRTQKGGIIKWSYPEQMKRYKDFAEQRDIPVFVAIGIGGEPSSPKSLYIVPLKQLRTDEISLSAIAEYIHPLEKNLFYSIETKTLN